MTQGMGAWMQRCREFTAVIADAGCRATLAAPIPVSLETQVAAVIAAMIFNRSRRAYL
jgi:hypothetical protein